MGSNNPLITRTTIGIAALALVSPSLFTACTEAPVEPSASSSATTTIQESPEESADVQELKSVYESFDPAQLTELTKQRHEESSDSNLVFVTEGLIEPDSELSVPKIPGANKKSLLVSYMCRSSAEQDARWRVDFRADSKPLESGVQSGSCNANSLEMFITRTLTPAKLPEALEATGNVELAVSIFEIEETS